ncbi:MAG TPA: cytochrome P450 [Pseudonocardia sp.]
MTDPQVVDFNHHSPEFAQNWKGIWRELQDKCPVAYTEAHDGHWVLTRYDDVAEIARNDEDFTSFNDIEGNGAKGNGILIPRGPLRFGIIEQDPPECRDLRALVAKWFAPSAIEALKPFIRERTTLAIDNIIEKGSGDLIMDVANPVPAAVTLHTVGLPVDDHLKYGEVFHKYLYIPPTEPEFADVFTGFMWCEQQFAEHVADRRTNPKNDLITALCQAKLYGEPIPDGWIIDTIRVFLGGGLDTTTSLTANGLYWLDEHPEYRERLRDNPEALNLATEEFLRYFAPIQALGRTVKDQPYQLRDYTLKPGDKVMMGWAAANRDPAEFENPDEFVIDRFPNRHTSFGLGAHRCLGAALARAQFQIMVGEILRRMPDYQVDRGQVHRYPSIGLANGYISLPVQFTPGERSDS